MQQQKQDESINNRLYPSPTNSSFSPPKLIFNNKMTFLTNKVYKDNNQSLTKTEPTSPDCVDDEIMQKKYIKKIKKIIKS